MVGNKYILIIDYMYKTINFIQKKRYNYYIIIMYNNLSSKLSNNVNNEIYYKDEYITLTVDSLEINKFYFPLKRVKVIRLRDINNIQLINLDRLNGKCTFFGLSWKGIYYHMDRRRLNKEKAVVVEDKESLFKVGITCENTEKFYGILRQLLYKSNKNASKELLNLDDCDNTEATKLKND